MTPDLTGKVFALLCALFWAAAVILFKKSGEKLSPIALNLYKTLISVVLILPLIFLEDISKNISALTTFEYLLLIISGFLGIAIADSLFFKSLNILGAGMTAIVDCVYSPMTILLAFLFLSEELRMSTILGSFLVAAAVVVGAYQKNKGDLDIKKTALGVSFGISGIFFMVVSVIIMKPVLAKTSVFFVTEIRLIAGLIGILILIFFRKNSKELLQTAVQRSNFRYALPGTILGNVLGMTLWIAAFKMTDINSAAILNQTNTIFILIFASIFLKEQFTAKKFISTVLAISGSLIVMLF